MTPLDPGMAKWVLQATDHEGTHQSLSFADLEASFENIFHFLDMMHVKRANTIWPEGNSWLF